jgi:hypothetical protein
MDGTENMEVARTIKMVERLELKNRERLLYLGIEAVTDIHYFYVDCIQTYLWPIFKTGLVRGSSLAPLPCICD